MTDLLKQYLELEKQMMQADDSGDEELAEKLRDQIDPIWYQLSDEDINFLNSRKID
jgi:hypothetical protein